MSAASITTPEFGAVDPPGQTSASTALAIVTGALDRVWQELAPDHPRYAIFAWAHRWQDSWSPAEHSSYWSAHLAEWPRIAAKPSRTGLMAARAAIWRRDGYSQAQIEAALGYSRDGAPRALWRRASDYYDRWLRQADWIERQVEYQPDDLDTFGLVAWHEELYASTVDPSVPTGGLRLDTGTPVVDPSAPDAAEQARRWVRRRWRTPRVVTLADQAVTPFGLPDPISEALLFSDADRHLVQRAEHTLRGQKPYHGAC